MDSPGGLLPWILLGWVANLRNNVTNQIVEPVTVGMIQN